MRKIYQSAEDVPQPIANKAVDIIERHLTSNGVRRAEELPEESKVQLLRKLQGFFRSNLPIIQERRGKPAHDRSSRGDGTLGQSVLRWLRRVFSWGDIEPDS